MASAQAIDGFDASLSFREGAARAVEVRTGELFGHRDGVLDMRDIERVHDMRVASRRLRAVLEVFAPCFPKREYSRVLRDVKALADALGARRDPDVATEALESMSAAFAPSDRAGVRHMIGELRGEQADGNDLLAEALEHMDVSGLEVRLLALAATARVPA